MYNALLAIMAWKYSSLFHGDEQKLFAKEAALLTRVTDSVHQVDEEEEEDFGLPLDLFENEQDPEEMFDAPSSKLHLYAEFESASKVEEDSVSDESDGNKRKRTNSFEGQGEDSEEEPVTVYSKRQRRG
jgi:hypothetical protein